MRAQQFIKVHGLERARDILEQRDRFTHVEKPTHFDIDLEIFIHENDFRNGKLDESDVDLGILKRLVESVDLIKYLGGYERTKARLQMARKNGTTFGIDHMKWKQAVKDYESIYGEGNE